MITKSRCSALADELVPAGRAAEAAERFLAWLQSGEPAAPRPLDTNEAKRRLLDACGGDRDRALALWADRDTVTAEELADLIAAALDAAPKASQPDAAGVADDPVREPETMPGGSSPPVDGDHEPDPAEGPPPSAGKGRGSTTSAMHPLQRKMHALVPKAWPDLTREARDVKRKGLISAITEGRTDSSSQLDDDALEDVCAALEQIEAGRMEVVQRASGEWTLRVRGGAKRTPASTGGEAA